jgi:diguanylate cyclase (GGDEF)-like protein
MSQTDRSMPAGAEGGRTGPGFSLLAVSERPDVLAEVEGLAGKDQEVRTAGDVGSALRALAAEEFDVVMADQALRPLTGLQLLRLARSEAPRAAGVLLVELADVGTAAEAVHRGQVYAGVLQPLRPDALLPLLHGAARQSRLRVGKEPLPDRLRRLRLDWVQALLDQGRQLEQEAEALTRDVRELEEANRRLRGLLLAAECQALTDPLTGLPNRRAIEDIAEREVRRRARYPAPLALGLVDADHFREINRRYLHPGGDQALLGISRALSTAVRGADRVGRIGGEEFLVVAPQTNQAGAEALAERLRLAVERAPVRYGAETIAVTVSLGFAVVDFADEADHAGLTRLAAEALAEAKRAGRNRAVVRGWRSSSPLAGEGLSGGEPEA